ncbi:MAG: response regulator transcription factor [Saprospiraceae bacterium]|nr:response regulator transcription factor [Saprospiraceae bacterium]
MTKIFIIDDHQIMINGIIDSLKIRPDLQVVGFALDAYEALKWIDGNPFDVILLDVSLPDTDGIELCKTIRKSNPQAKIIGLTTFHQVSFIQAMLKNGASGYLFKNTTAEQLCTAIDTVVGGDQYLSEEVKDAIVQKSAFSSRHDSFVPKLTRREKEVLELILSEKTTQEIADSLFLSVSTVETHRMNLCTKLGARNTAGMVKNAIKFGLI